MAAAPEEQEYGFCCPSFLERAKVDLKQTFSTSAVELISKPCQQIACRMLVLVSTSTTNATWQFAFIAKEPSPDGQIIVHNCSSHSWEILDVKRIRQLMTLQQYRWQPHMSQAYILALLKSFIAQYKQAQLKPFLYTKIFKQTDKIIVVGDLHGSAKSIRIILEDLYIKGLVDKDGILDPHVYLFFTGDYSDRGPHSQEVWAILAQLKMSNPEHLFLLRGNHESLAVAKDFDFFASMQAFLALEDDLIPEQFLTDLFYSLPQAFIMGCPTGESSQGKTHFSFLLVCHGGIEEAASLTFPMRIAVDAYQKNMSDQPIFSHELFPGFLAQIRSELFEFSGFMWSDFFASTHDHVDPETKCSERGDWLKQYNSSFVRSYLEQHIGASDQGSFSLDAIIRGHQHIPGGVARLLSAVFDERQWQPLQHALPEIIERGSVYTCTSSPDGLGLFNCCEDSYALIELTDAKRWHITPTIKTRVPKKCASLSAASVNDCPTM